MAFDTVVRLIGCTDGQIARAEARRARLLAEAASLAEAMAAREGSMATSSGREWVRRRLSAEIACATRRTEAATARLIDEGERLVRELPATLEAMETGVVSYAHARVVISHSRSVPEEHRGRFEQTVLPLAASVPARRFDEHARRLREREHPESVEVRSAAAREERYVQLVPEYDGMATIYHCLPVVDAIAIDDLLDKTARAARCDADERTHAQRRSDALTDFILGRAERRIVPTVVVTVPAATVAGGSEPAELHGYGAIDPGVARTLLATAPSFLRALLHPDSGEPVVITRHRFAERYSAPNSLRTALMIADETCRFPGCGRRAARCELDHTRAWAEGGRTRPDNLAHLCSRHHHLKHEGGWRVEAAGGNRSLRWTSPRGATYTTHPRGVPASFPRSARFSPPREPDPPRPSPGAPPAQEPNPPPF